MKQIFAIVTIITICLCCSIDIKTNSKALESQRFEAMNHCDDFKAVDNFKNNLK